MIVSSGGLRGKTLSFLRVIPLVYVPTAQMIDLLILRKKEMHPTQKPSKILENKK